MALQTILIFQYLDKSVKSYTGRATILHTEILKVAVELNLAKHLSAPNSQDDCSGFLKTQEYPAIYPFLLYIDNCRQSVDITGELLSLPLFTLSTSYVAQWTWT